VTQLCETCGHYYDDEFTWTLCPHGPLWAPLNAYCREHDLVNCKLHGDGTQPYVAPVSGRRATKERPHWECPNCGTINEDDPEIEPECWRCRQRKPQISYEVHSGVAFPQTQMFKYAEPLRGNFWPWLRGWLLYGWRSAHDYRTRRRIRKIERKSQSSKTSRKAEHV
jgi:hypothetical protein